ALMDQQSGGAESRIRAIRVKPHEHFDIELLNFTRGRKVRCAQARTDDGAPQRFERVDRLGGPGLGLHEIPSLAFDPRQSGKPISLSLYIAYGAADLERFLQAGPRPRAISGLAEEAAEIPQRDSQPDPVAGLPQDLDGALMTLPRLFPFTELRVFGTHAGQGDRLPVGVFGRAPQRQRFGMQFQRLA